MTWRVLVTFFGGGGGGDYGDYGDDGDDGDDGGDGNDGDDGDGLEDYGDRAAFPGWVVRESESRV